MHFIACKFYLKYATKHEPSTEKVIYRKPRLKAINLIEHKVLF